MGIERRKEKRLRVALPVKVIYGKKEEIIGITDNISRLGSYLDLNRQFASGTELEVILEIPNYANDTRLCGAVKCRGTVFRCDLREIPGGKTSYGIGIFFTSFPVKEDGEKLSKYVDFLIVQEEEVTKEGFKKWKEKKLGTDARRRLEYEKTLSEMHELLKKVLVKLDKIEKAVQS